MANHREDPISAPSGSTERGWAITDPLLLIALATDVLTPILIWKRILPPQTRWLSHASLTLVILGTFARMFVFNRFPLALWAIVWMSVTGIGVAILRGQGVAPTLWGWWLMFQYPLIALYVYLQPRWPTNFPRRLYMNLVAILGLQVVVQTMQYLTGEIPGDNLAGTFGRNGTGNLVLFIIIILGFALGNWLARRQWIPLFVIMVLGGISSVLGEIKLFWVAVAVMGGLAIVIYVLQRGSFHRLIPLGAFLAAMLIVFTTWYNAVVPQADQTPLQEYLENPEQLLEYLNYVRRYEDEGSYVYDIGRNVAIRYAWTSLSNEPLSLIFGLGLGARALSDTLGFTGTALSGTNFFAFSPGTSLLVMMQELGIFGMAVLVVFIILTTIILARDIRRDPESEAAELRYALILFTVLWPLWIWYNLAWTLRVPMLIYWVMLGYVIAEARNHKLQHNRPVESPKYALRQMSTK